MLLRCCYVYSIEVVSPLIFFLFFSLLIAAYPNAPQHINTLAAFSVWHAVTSVTVLVGNWMLWQPDI